MKAPILCEECGAAHTNSRYCSRSCASKAAHRVPKKPKGRRSKGTLDELLKE